MPVIGRCRGRLRLSRRRAECGLASDCEPARGPAQQEFHKTIKTWSYAILLAKCTAPFWGRFLGDYRPIESTVYSGEKSDFAYSRL
jgi:hypothetical protein